MGLSPRQINFGGFSICVLLMAYAYYLQYVEGREPCPLCIFQRVGLVALGLTFLSMTVYQPGRIGQRIYAVLLGLIAIAGAGVAGRHVWLQNLPPDKVPACGPDLATMMQAWPLQTVIQNVLRGSGECAIVDWSFLGISIPGWCLIWFIVLGIVGVTVNIRASLAR
ncbi:disulfide bond formation protein B [Candidatus Macondimonas diazotrophica]|uniref:Disulfide bond formation protein B n=1 Tax=Candidatus Macondimonas diazotrophica TaxID=2305248 RepID=A0A4Z0F8F6_9GAMM|nr:disulfide bond formation protein B [Candidatus Macondimonas diazotrophica]NCU01674.1 disulfide bond formation protein B [Candidatus Macondimonas diazotrophica]TFZ81765.1 disulfide bond formation protein B [Candidatus Macondimonas diazotrophica]HBG30105.1 disulfide bond formation protein B [Gammaproteobacteria bacterium]HBG51301.1 disulfide bond formation protein B [Gammaproteobacteria bacterium]